MLYAVRRKAASIADLALAFFRGVTVQQISGRCAAVPLFWSCTAGGGYSGPLLTAPQVSPLDSLVQVVGPGLAAEVVAATGPPVWGAT